MKTTIEWFEKELQKNFNIEGVQPLYDDILEKAKKMEKQQKSYNEEEVLEIIKKLYVEIGFQFTNEIKEWCSKQFKNK